MSDGSSRGLDVNNFHIIPLEETIECESDSLPHFAGILLRDCAAVHGAAAL